MTCLKALDNPVGGVTSFKEESGRSSAAIDDSVFEVNLLLLQSDLNVEVFSLEGAPQL